jgi:hypothetical protein
MKIAGATRPVVRRWHAEAARTAMPAALERVVIPVPNPGAAARPHRRSRLRIRGVAAIGPADPAAFRGRRPVLLGKSGPTGRAPLPLIGQE